MPRDAQVNEPQSEHNESLVLLFLYNFVVATALIYVGLFIFSKEFNDIISNINFVPLGSRRQTCPFAKG